MKTRLGKSFTCYDWAREEFYMLRLGYLRVFHVMTRLGKSFTCYDYAREEFYMT